MHEWQQRNEMERRRQQQQGSVWRNYLCSQALMIVSKCRVVYQHVHLLCLVQQKVAQKIFCELRFFVGVLFIAGPYGQQGYPQQGPGYPPSPSEPQRPPPPQDQYPYPGGAPPPRRDTTPPYSAAEPKRPGPPQAEPKPHVAPKPAPNRQSQHMYEPRGQQQGAFFFL